MLKGHNGERRLKTINWKRLEMQQSASLKQCSLSAMWSCDLPAGKSFQSHVARPALASFLEAA